MAESILSASPADVSLEYWSEILYMFLWQSCQPDYCGVSSLSVNINKVVQLQLPHSFSAIAELLVKYWDSQLSLGFYVDMNSKYAIIVQ